MSISHSVSYCWQHEFILTFNYVRYHPQRNMKESKIKIVGLGERVKDPM